MRISKRSPHGGRPGKKKKRTKKTYNGESRWNGQEKRRPDPGKKVLRGSGKGRCKSDSFNGSYENREHGAQQHSRTKKKGAGMGCLLLSKKKKRNIGTPLINKTKAVPPIFQ